MIPSCSLLATRKPPSGGGGGGSQPLIHDQNIVKGGPGTHPVSVSYTINTDGNAYASNQVPALEAWLQSGGTASNYQVQATYTGDTPTGVLNTWTTISSSQQWGLNAAAGVVAQCVLTVSIRDAAGPNTVRTSATITITCQNDGGGVGGG